jgi:hypothetical protein
MFMIVPPRAGITSEVLWMKEPKDRNSLLQLAAESKITPAIAHKQPTFPPCKHTFRHLYLALGFRFFG